MHYRFKSRADADLLMMQPVAEQLLAIVGRQPAPQGIIELQAIPAAIAALEGAIADERALQKRTGGDRVADDDADGGGDRIGLSRRAWPLLEMMKRSVAEKSDIVWGV